MRVCGRLIDYVEVFLLEIRMELGVVICDTMYVCTYDLTLRTSLPSFFWMKNEIHTYALL